MSKQNARSLSICSQESYSAVMIADLVAEVPVSPESQENFKKFSKEETNLAYDGHLDGDAKSSEGLDASNSHFTNGGGISKGVILNAVQFGQSDSKFKSDEKAIQMTATLPAPQLTQQISEPKGFKDMSFPRKVAFGFSFLPSVLFVLCFAVILPCNVLKPCIEELWSTTLNNTEALSRLEVPHHMMFIALEENESFLMELNKDSGKKNIIARLDAGATHFQCGKIMRADGIDCFILDEEGKFYSFNESRKNIIQISEDGQISPSVILPSCNGNGINSVAVAVSNSTVKIIHEGNLNSTLSVLNCDFIPTKLFSLSTDDSTDIIFVCSKNETDVLGIIPQNIWCGQTEDIKDDYVTLYEGFMDSLNNTIIQPVKGGLVLWSEDKVSMVQPNGSFSWNVSSVPHSEENRYVLSGTFEGENDQVVLLSNSLSSGIQVTLLEASSGDLVNSFNLTESEISDVVTIHGKKKDFILILHKKVKGSMSAMTTALEQITGLSTTIASLISNDEVENVPSQLIPEELSFLDLEGKLTLIKELTDLKDSDYKTSMTAMHDEDMDALRIYLLSTSNSNAQTRARNINIANWSKSKKSKCLGKIPKH